MQTTHIEIPAWATAEKPWDEAKKLKVVRSDYRDNEVIDRGVNFFVLTLEALGARPKFSCEGHPTGFYVLFRSSFELVRELSRLGYFRVEVETRGDERGWWSIRVGSMWKSEKEKRCTLRWAAEAWQKAFWGDDPSLREYMLQTNIDAVCRTPSVDRGCEGKLRLSLTDDPPSKARRLALKHGHDLGVYLCPHCHTFHLTSKLDKADEYAPLLYRTNLFGDKSIAHAPPSRRYLVRSEPREGMCLPAVKAWQPCHSLIRSSGDANAIDAQWVGFFIDREVAETVKEALEL